MNEISCDICMDLMPLVTDGVASPDSATAVAQHIRRCPACAARFEGDLPAPEPERILARVQSKLRILAAMALAFGMILGLSLTAGNDLFQNVIIMPLVGAIGYYLFRWKSVFLVPGLLLLTHLVTNALGLGTEVLDMVSLVMWTAIYSGFAEAGIVIASLLHFALKKE